SGAHSDKRPWGATPLTDEQLSNPISVIPPAARPRVVLRYANANELLVSGLLDNGGELGQHAAVIDSPYGQGHVGMFSNNPFWRAETKGSYFLVFNAFFELRQSVCRKETRRLVEPAVGGALGFRFV